ncbi:unnamed protein product [Arabidopsis lyrata]|nr:unnamed protein product [Arabidopsis lyrata]
MTMDSKVCSLRFHLRKEEDLVDLYIKQVDLLNQVEISTVFHCAGLLLCVAKDNSRLVVWNPYLGQTRWIGPRTSFHRLDKYALGYNINRNHKILRFVDECIHLEHLFGFEIYDFSSNSWRVLDIRPDWEVEFYQRGVSLKGNTYFFAHEKLGADLFAPVGIGSGGGEDVTIDLQQVKDFLLCFDFTTEKFGPRLPLPFHSIIEDTVTLSCVREEQLAVLYQQGEDSIELLEIWVTTNIEPNAVSWSKFLKVDMRPQLTGFVAVRFDHNSGSFFIDEQEKVAVVFDVDGYRDTETARYHTAFIIGDDGYFKSVSLGEAPNVYDGKPGHLGYTPQFYCPPLVCSSSYLPSFVSHS